MKPRVLITLLLLLASSALATTTNTIGRETAQTLGSSANYRLFIGNAPDDGSIQTLNPPIFKWLYFSNALAIGYPNTTLQTFRFQGTTSGAFASPLWNIVTSNNFYNCLPPITNADGSAYTGTVQWRVGYMDGSANPATLVWGNTNSFTVAANATPWDRSQYGDPNYLISVGANHPHMFFDLLNRAAMAGFLHTNTAMGFSWLVTTQTAYSAITQSWWNNDSFTNFNPQSLAEKIIDVCLTYQMDSNAVLKAANPGQMVDRFASSFIANNFDFIDSYTLNETPRCIALGYDWAYDDMTTAQRSNTLWCLERPPQNYVYYGWWHSGSPLDPNHVYPGPYLHDYQSGSKANSSHDRHDQGTGLFCCWAGMGESAILRDDLGYFLNYQFGQVDPFNGDEGRAYAEQSWRTLHGFGAQLLLACYDPRMTNNPWYQKYPKMFCYWEPLNYVEIQDQFGDFGLQMRSGQADTYQTDYKYYDEAIMLGSGPMLRQFTNNTPIRSHAPDVSFLYGEAYLRFYFTNTPAQADWPDTYYFDEQDGWCMSYTYAPNTFNCFTNGVGMILTGRPAGSRNEHGTWHDGAIQIWAYGAQVTCGGIGEYYKHPWLYPGLFVDGIGNSTPNGQNPSFPFYSQLTDFTNCSDFTYVKSDISHAMNNVLNPLAGGGNGNLEAAYTQSTNTRPYISSVTRSVLFPHKAYTVLIDNMQTTRPAQFEWKWNVMETNNLVVHGVGSFDYTCTNFFNGSNVTVYVRHIAATNNLLMSNLLGTNWCTTNPITHEDFSSVVTGLGHYEPRWNATELVYNATPSENVTMISVIVPAKWGVAAPTITAIDDTHVKVDFQGVTDIISADGTAIGSPSDNQFIINPAATDGGGSSPLVIFFPAWK